MVRRNDTDIVVLSNRYIDEVRLLPPEKMNGKKANIRVTDPTCMIWYGSFLSSNGHKECTRGIYLYHGDSQQ